MITIKGVPNIVEIHNKEITTLNELNNIIKQLQDCRKFMINNPPSKPPKEVYPISIITTHVR